MTVSTTTSTAQFDPNGVTINFPFAFRFFAATDLKVFWQKPDGTIQLLVLNSNYTVQGAGNDAGGSITTIGTPLPNGLLVVSRIMVATQLTSFRNQGEFFAEIHEDAFDKLVMLVQQTIDNQGRGLTVPVADPLNINLVLPGAVARAGKALGFDVSGQPIVSTLTLEQIEQQPALALEAAEQAAASAEAAGDSEAAADQSASTSAAAAAAAAASAQSVAYAAMQLGMSTWGYRAQPFQGFALDDGQELDRAVYPAFVAALDAGLLPTVTQAQWNADPANRACFVAVSSAGKFRMRDLNGVSSGSLGAAFLRGGNASQPQIRQDQIQNITGTAVGTALNIGAPGGQVGAFTTGGAVTSRPTTISATGYDLVFDASRVARTGNETYPTHASGAWMTRLFGVITPLGSAEAASLATAYASLASRASVLEGRATALEYGFISTPQTYSNGGTLTIAHGLGVVPARVSVDLQIIAAAAGFSIGDVLALGSAQNLLDTTGNQFGFGIRLTSTNLVCRISAQGIVAIGTSNVNATIPAASARLVFKASKS